MRSLQGKTNIEVYPAVKSGVRLPQPESCGDAVYAMLCRCWAADAHKRPAFSGTLLELEALMAASRAAKPREIGAVVRALAAAKGSDGSVAWSAAYDWLGVVDADMAQPEYADPQECAALYSTVGVPEAGTVYALADAGAVYAVADEGAVYAIADGNGGPLYAVFQSGDADV